MQLEVILAENRIATAASCKAETTKKRRKRKTEIVSVPVMPQVLSLIDELSCPQIWNIEQEKDREVEKVGGRPAKLNEKKKTKKTKEAFFLLEEQHENFVAAVTK